MDAPNIPQQQTAGLTVGSLRYLLEGLDDMTPIGVAWQDGEVPGDDAPAVSVFGFRRDRHNCQSVDVLVGLAWMGDE